MLENRVWRFTGWEIYREGSWKARLKDPGFAGWEIYREGKGEVQMEEKKELEIEKAGSPLEEKKGDALLSETWAEDAQATLEDFIEQQGIYIRQ